MRQPVAGFVCFGEVNTPSELIQEKRRMAEQWLKQAEVDIIPAGVVTDDPDGAQANAAIETLLAQSFDFLVICIAGWIPSWTVVKVASAFAHHPMLLWGLSGRTTNGRLVSTADQAGTTALRKVLDDLAYSFKYVYHVPDGEPSIGAVSSFARAARTASLLRRATVGMMGYRDMKLYGTMFDGIKLKRLLGVEIEFFEMLEIVQRREGISDDRIGDIVKSVRANWEFEKPAKDETLQTGAGLYAAIRDKVCESHYDAVSLIDVDGMKKLLGFPPAMIFMLLGEEPGVCTIPENDALGAVTQLIVRYLTGQAAPYMEFYEFMEDRVLIGVPDFVPSEIVDGRVRVTPTAFGGLGEGVLNISKVRTGPVTLVRLTESGEGYAIHAITGRAEAPRPWEEAGWQPPAPQLPSLEVVLDLPVVEFAQKVLSQHYIIAYGDILDEIADLRTVLHIDEW